MRIAVQIGHVNGQAGAAHEEETLKLLLPHVVARLQQGGHSTTIFDGRLQHEPANNQHDYDAAVFLHCDSGGTSSTGFSIGYWEEMHPGSQALALVLRDVYARASGLRFIGFNITVGEHHYYGNRRFTRRTKCTLIEFGFVSNPNERAYLQANAQKLGHAVADAYIRYFGGTQSAEEDEMAIAVERSPDGVTRWDFTGYLMQSKGSVLYVDIVNLDNKPISVTLDYTGADGGRLTKQDALSVQPRSAVGKSDFAAVDVGAVLGVRDVGNCHVIVTADGRFLAKMTQLM